VCLRERAEEEIFLSKKEVEVLTGRSCRHFAYPNGDYTDDEVKMIRNSGYLSARTVDAGWVGPGSDPFKLKAMEVADDASVNWMVAQVSGVAQFVKGTVSRSHFSQRGGYKG
jgi:hypothetical protein